MKFLLALLLVSQVAYTATTKKNYVGVVDD
jgi:hypothetical protein